MVIINYKLKILSISVLFSVLVVGCIDDTQTNTQTNAQTNYSLKYNFDKGDRFAYDLLSSIETPKNTRTSMHVEMVVSDISSNLINMQIESTATRNGNKTESSYHISINDYGELIESDSEDLIISEIQLELPNILVYPEKMVQQGETWTDIIRRDGAFSSKEGAINYSVVGTKDYTCLGLKNISCEAGNFLCIGINTDINFTLEMSTKTPNGTVYATTVGKVSGENWVDSKSCFLVDSFYEIHQTTTIDLSEVYENTMGFKSFYQETPTHSSMKCELVGVN